MHRISYVKRLNAFLERMAQRYEAAGDLVKAEAVRQQSIPEFLAR